MLARLIVGGHTTESIRAVKEVYDFELLNLYFAEDAKREKALAQPLDFVQWCEENDITSFSTTPDRIEPELIESSLISYVFTVNDEELAKDLRSAGVSVIGTDFLE